MADCCNRWVFNTKLQQKETQGHSVFDPSKSSTFKLLRGASFAISYGDQSKASGLVGTDTVDIGGATAENQAVELATDISDSFTSDVESDGLVGLAFSSINQVQPKSQKTFFENVQSTLDKPVFTANLKHATLGNYEFGRIDDTQHQGSIAYTPVNDTQGFWQFESNSFAVGNGRVQTNPNASPAIADTGTSLIVADDNVVRSYWRNVQGAQDSESGITFPCEFQLPDLHIAMGPNYMATIPGALMSFQKLQEGVCYGGLQSNQGQPLQILGDVMFKALFVVFDGGEKRIGFAPHA